MRRDGNGRGDKLMSRKGFKLVILDEADMMTQAAQGALRRGKSKFHTSLSPTLFFLDEDLIRETVIDGFQRRNVLGEEGDQKSRMMRR